MKNTAVVKIAFSVCTLLSLVIGAFLLLNVKAIPKYTRLIDSGKKIQGAILEMELGERNYILYHQEDMLESIKDKAGNLKEIYSFYEKSTFAEKSGEFFEFAVLEEAINLYERLLDQFFLYHKAVEKNIAEIRDLEKNILAVIYSKMNPERGIIGLQEIRIHEKGYLIYRNYPNPPDERSFEDKRKEAISNLLLWAQNDKRIEELMDKDNQLFTNITKNYEGRDSTLQALKSESGKIRKTAEKFLEEGDKGLYTIYRRCAFLCIILLIMWLITGTAIAATRFADTLGTEGKG
jgi:hypothetical protein